MLGWARAVAAVLETSSAHALVAPEVDEIAGAAAGAPGVAGRPPLSGYPSAARG